MPCHVDPSPTEDRAYREGWARHESQVAAYLCEVLQGLPLEEFKKLPMQIQGWWAEHEERDRQRVQRETEERERTMTRAAALAKLTPHERALLGIP